MKSILIVLLFGIIYNCSYSQEDKTVHLSFNIKEDKECLFVKKKTEKINEVHFYIGSEHFEWNPKRSIEKISELEINSINILNISSFVELAEDKRKKFIKEGQKNKSIKILFNDKVFDEIYLYEKDRCGVIKKYNVKWIEEIE